MTTLIPTRAKKVVVIGCGAGVTAGAVTIDPAVIDQTIAEDRAAGAMVGRLFGSTTSTSSTTPGPHQDDARRYCSTNEKFDAITSDRWARGSEARRYSTREFFELASA